MKIYIVRTTGVPIYVRKTDYALQEKHYRAFIIIRITSSRYFAIEPPERRNAPCNPRNRQTGPRENNARPQLIGPVIGCTAKRARPVLPMQIRSDTVLEIRLGPSHASTMRRLRRQWAIINHDK